MKDRKKVVFTMLLLAVMITSCGVKTQKVEIPEGAVTNFDAAKAVRDIESIPEIIRKITDDVTMTAGISSVFEEVYSTSLESIEGINPEEESVTEIYENPEETDKEVLSSIKAPEQVLADEIVNLTNKYRKELGLTELTVDKSLIDAAKVRAKEITVNWSHTRPDGSDWFTVNDAIMYGENLSKGYSTAESVMQAWKDSKIHNDVLIEPGYKTIGVYVFVDSDGKVWIAQEFGY